MEFPPVKVSCIKFRLGFLGVIGKIYMYLKICIKMHCIPAWQLQGIKVIPLDIGEATDTKNTLPLRAL